MSLLSKKSKSSVAITPLNPETLGAWAKAQPKRVQEWLKSSGYTAAAGAILLLQNDAGGLERVLLGAGKDDSLYTYADLPARLPKNDAGYFIDTKMTTDRANSAALGWILGSYHFAKYKKKKEFVQLVWPETADKKFVTAFADSIYMARDLINTPANDLGPDELEAACRKLMTSYEGKISVIKGEDLLKKNYPAVYEVGKASPRKPRLIDMRWGNPKHPKLTLVGKGVCYDTGGLNIKTENYMLLMKKDMGGAAGVLALARLIMSQNLPVSLRVIVPCVENSIAGNAFRPGDVINTRKGLTIEIGNTDAEGRLILADALFEASADKPELLIDFATLTGAARAALGPEIPNLFCNDDATANALLASSVATEDYLWRMPLWQPYKDSLASKIADMNNIGASLGGHIVAALFLESFVGAGIPWVHLDTNAYNNTSKPGKPEGGEALAVRACYDMISKKFAKGKK